MFLEHKHLYLPAVQSQRAIRGPIITIPFGKARVVRERALTSTSIITFPEALVHRAEVCCTAQLDREGVSAEVIDLRSLAPYDWEAIATSVQKTSRVIVAYEDTLSWGYGAKSLLTSAMNSSAISMRQCGRVAATDTFARINRFSKTRFFHKPKYIVRAVRDLSRRTSPADIGGTFRRRQSVTI